MDSFLFPVRTIFAEVYLSTERGWLLTEYTYNFVERGRGRFYGYHHHPIVGIGGAGCITHEHCTPPEIDGAHFRGAWIDLREAHWEFVKWAADPSSYPDCRLKRPLLPGASPTAPGR